MLNLCSKTKPTFAQNVGMNIYRMFSTQSSDFKLDKNFLEMYSPDMRKPVFGFNGLGEIAYLRSYARFRDELGRQERWNETVERVVNGCFSIQKMHCLENSLPWHE